MATDFYGVLGVSRDATEKQIREAYRRLARRYHPDVNPGDVSSEERFKEINAAHEVLSDPDSRSKYDRYGDQWQHADELEAMRRQGGGPFSFGGGTGDPSDVFGDLDSLFGGRQRSGARQERGGGIFDTLFGRRGGRRRGQDIEHTTQISLEEAAQGATRTIEVREGEEQCRICAGAGTLAGATCHACRGTGSATPLRRIEVTIPPGIADGTRIRVGGKGGGGEGGGAAGDLFLRVRVNHDSRFTREGDDLHTVVEVAVADAVLGGEVRVPTLKGGQLALKIPPGTQGGRGFRLAGQGMPKQDGGFGDLRVEVQLRIPERLSGEQRELFERLRETEGGRSSADRTSSGGGTDAEASER
jgi:DnaJ-class molecular chaperone